MSGKLKTWLVVGTCLAALGCGSRQPPPAETAQQADDGTGSQASKLEAPPPEPAPTPSGVLLRARVKNPEALANAATEAASSPIGVRQLLEGASPEGRRLFDEVLDPSAPVEALIALNPVTGRDPFAAWSVSARGTRPVLAALDREQREFREGPGGVFYFQVSEWPCAVGRSRGPSRARIVCADREESLQALSAYMLRGLPDEALSTAAVHVELLGAPVLETYGRQIKQLGLLASVAARQFHQGDEALDRAISDAVRGLAAELGDLVWDVEKVEFQVRERDRNFEVSLRLVQKGQKSWTAAALTAASGTQEPAPAMFRALPATASAASYARWLPKERTLGVRETVTELIRGALGHQGLSPGSSKRLAEAVTDLALSEQVAVAASGPLVVQGGGADAGLGPAWRLWGTSRPHTEVNAGLGALASVISSREFQKMMTTNGESLTFKRMAAQRGILAGAVVYEWKVPEDLAQLLDWSGALKHAGVADSKLRETAFDGGHGFLAMKELGGETWLATGRTLQMVSDGLGALEAKDRQTLADRSELASFLSIPSVSGGFVQVSGVLGSISALIPAELARRVPGMLEDAPHAGRVPATYTYRIQTGGSLETSVAMHVPAEFITDAAALALMAGVEGR